MTDLINTGYAVHSRQSNTE